MAGFQQVKVNRDLEFVGAAAYQPNVKGPMMTEYKIFDEQFTGAIALTGWDGEASNGSTHTQGAVDGGAHVITCGATALDCGELMHIVQWSPDKACGVEIKMKISAITNVCVCGGFVDAKEDLDDHVAGELNSSAVLYTATKTNDLALFIFDTDATSDVWYCASMNNDSKGTPVAALGSLVPVANTYFKIRLQTNTDGDVTYYYNGVAVGHLANAIADADTDLLTPYVGIISRSTGAVVCTVSRITTWQECS